MRRVYDTQRKVFREKLPSANQTMPGVFVFLCVFILGAVATGIILLPVTLLLLRAGLMGTLMKIPATPENMRFLYGLLGAVLATGGLITAGYWMWMVRRLAVERQE